MKGFKKFLIYLFIILGVLITITLIIFAFMYFSPNTPVLGFEYVSYKSNQTKVFNSTSDPSVQNIQSVEIYSDNCDIYIYPNEQSGEIKVVEVQDFTGFAREVNSSLSVEEKINYNQYEENSLNLKTFMFVLKEPNGWISKNKSKLEVYISNNLNLNTIFAKTNGGNVYYNSTLNESNISCENLFLKSSGSGNIYINNNQSINNYYLTTENGSANFNNLNSITSNLIKFETNNGSFVASNQNKNCELKSNLTVKSNSTGSGPYIDVDILNGNFSVNSNKGTYNVNKIGKYGEFKTISVSSNKSNIYFGTVYGNVSVLSTSKAEKNNVTISELIYTSLTNTFETGAGNLIINKLQGNVAVETTSGNVQIDDATTSSDICAYTKSGNINVKYKYSEQNNKDNFLKVITNTGNINLDNVSCFLEVKVLSNSNASCNIGFSAVSSLENTLDILNRQANLYFINSGANTRCRIVSKKEVNIIGTAIGSDISSQYDESNIQNEDYILNEYDGFNYSYRINYNKDDETYTHATYMQMGIIVINSTSLTNVYAKTLS